ncbi:hypothetical protein V6N13_149598 [Hibiscus sabdariffa]|uniref:Receptor-like serine/threonine-protein kinase n=1 Tax=Hibiscus sabdariffa TaxID=183260 RepID=A0ABR2EGX6_9ROSI
MAFLLLFLLSFVFNPANAQSRSSIIEPGSSLSPNNNSYWLSESGQFAFGFYPYGNGYSVGIWFENIPQKTVVWTLNRDDPPFTGDATLLLSTQGRLTVRPTQGREVLIAGVANAASSASMLDSGNFVLFGSSSGIIWQSFDFPTDTILPGQPLVVNSKLVSDVSETNHTSGKFQIIMQDDGNLVQYPVEAVGVGFSYWSSETNHVGYGASLNLDSEGLLYLQNATGFNITSLNNKVAATGKSIYRATIDADGIFRLYSHSSNRLDNWFIEWSSSDNKCDPIGLCGENSYCFSMEGEPVCQCPPRFVYIDEEHKDLGCRKNYSLVACTERNYQTFNFSKLVDFSWKDSDSYLNVSARTENDCRSECSRDCNCEAALYNNQSCKMLKLPLRFGRRDTSSQIITLLKIAGELAGPGTRKRKLRIDILITSLALACSTLVFLVVAAIGVLKYRSRVQEYNRILCSVNNRVAEDVALKSFTLEELKDATNNFVEEIGKGAYGTVFRGVISEAAGERMVAIKRLEKVVAEGEREFRNEMKAIGITHHKNLVRLLGYCYDGTDRLLVYEYMKNGSLADFLFKSKLKINWEGRVEIVLNIARGLCYLHEECETQIIHCDIKPENILMDDNGYAKIADFGLAKLLMPNQSKTYTGLRGTMGYVAPEWVWNLPITVKADVYSFGIMLFEIVCCRRRVEADVPENEQFLADWVYDCFKANEVEMLVRNEEVTKSKLERMVKVGLWCIQDEALSRPSMKEVTLMLEGRVNIPDPPLLRSFLRSPDPLLLGSFVSSP